MESRLRSSPEQFTTLLEFLEIHGDLSKPNGLEGRMRSEFLWAECTKLLNAVKGGVNKTTEKWKKVWADIKSKTKKKALNIKHHACATGDGIRSQQIFLSELEKRVLTVLGMQDHAPIKATEVDVLNSSAPFESPQSITEGKDIIYLEVKNVFAGSRPSTPQSGSRLTLPDPTSPPPASPPPYTSPGRSRTSASPPPVSSRRPRSKTRSTVPSAVSSRRRVRTRYRPPNPYERAASEYAALEFRRLELEEMRDRMQHEREMRALDLEQERVKLFSSVVDIAQAWFQCYSSKHRSNTE